VRESKRNVKKARRLGLVALAIALFAAALACAEPEHWGEGVVREVYPDRNEVVIEHGDIPGLMKGMTMGFEAAEPSLLEGLEPGKPVRFRVVVEGGRYRVDAVEPQ